MEETIRPPFTLESAAAKVQLAENLWNSRDPERVALAYTEDSVWRNRTEFIQGRKEIVEFLRHKWKQELDYRLKKELWGFRNNRMAVKFQYEWHNDSGEWFRSYGVELWEFAEDGLMRRREASINDLPISVDQRQIALTPASAADVHPPVDLARVYNRTATVEGLKIFYREAGAKNAPVVVLLHGFPSSSHMYRELIPLLADRYHVIAPDYPGFGYSDAPSIKDFAYTFDHLADVVDRFLDQLNVKRYSIYIQDYGSPVGFRLATRHPERIQTIITQNGNAYEEGLSPFWADNLYPFWKDRNLETEAKVRDLLTLATTKFQYTQGYRNPEHINPDTWTFDQAGLDRPGNSEIQLALFYDYRTNPPLYPRWHEYLKTKQPPVLAVWGKNDPIFLPAGAEAYLRDNPNTELHLLDTGHFALEEEVQQISQLIHAFIDGNVK